MSERPKVQHSKCCVVQATPGSNPGATAINSRHAIELRPETWTRLMVAVMRLPVGPGPGILPGSGP